MPAVKKRKSPTTVQTTKKDKKVVTKRIKMETSNPTSVEFGEGVVVELEFGMLWSDFFPILQVAQCVGLLSIQFQFDVTKGIVSFQSMDYAHISLIRCFIPISAFSQLKLKSTSYTIELPTKAFYKAAQRKKTQQHLSDQITLQVLSTTNDDMCKYTAYVYHGEPNKFDSFEEIPVLTETLQEELTIPENTLPFISVCSHHWKRALHAFAAVTEDIEVGLHSGDAIQSITVRNPTGPMTQRLPATSTHVCSNQASSAINQKGLFKLSYLEELSTIVHKIASIISFKLPEDSPLHIHFCTWKSDTIRKLVDDTLTSSITIIDLRNIVLNYVTTPNLLLTFDYFIAPKEQPPKSNST